jgi:hypothetical protein
MQNPSPNVPLPLRLELWDCDVATGDYIKEKISFVREAEYSNILKTLNGNISVSLKFQNLYTGPIMVPFPSGTWRCAV